MKGNTYRMLKIRMLEALLIQIIYLMHPHFITKIYDKFKYKKMWDRHNYIFMKQQISY